MSPFASLRRHAAAFWALIESGADVYGDPESVEGFADRELRQFKYPERDLRLSHLRAVR